MKKGKRMMNRIPLARRGQATRLAEIVPAKPEATVPPPLRIVESDVCPICKGDGWLRSNKRLGDPLFGKLIKCQCRMDASERTARATNRHRTYRWAGQSEELAEAMEAMTFASFKPIYRLNGEIINFTEAFQKARGYADLLRAQAKGQQNALLVGSYGVGKTHLAGAILNELRAEGIGCLFTTAPGLFKTIYASTFEDQQRLMLEMSTTKVFVLDDLDKLHVKQETNPEIKPGSYQKSILFDILDARYVAKLPTIITTNEENDLSKWLDRAVISRLFGNILGIEMIGQDYRQVRG